MSQSNKAYKVIISGGGTGGHIYPAIAIANALKEAHPGIEILFVGAKDRMEMQKVPAAGYSIEGIWISGIQRRLTMDNLLFPVKVVSSIFQAWSILKKFKADIAIGVGGYASWPLLFTANLMGIPTLIQEQNSYAGVTNKFLAKNVEKICVAYDKMNKFFPADKLVVTGNPVRKDILNVDTKREKANKHFGLRSDLKTILVIGGSLGARTINQSVAANLSILEKENIQLLWQTGKFYFDDAKSKVKEEVKDKVKVMDFIYEMDLAYAAADIVVSRAGALSISELCLAKKPAILVPSPNVAEDHQTKNAMALVEKNAAILVKDNVAQKELIPAAVALLNDESKKFVLKENIAKLGKPDAANEIANVVLRIIESKGGKA